MKIERKQKNGRRFSSLDVGSAFEYNGRYYMRTETVDTDFDEDEYQTTYNAVDLANGHLDWFNHDCIVELLDATLMI